MTGTFKSIFRRLQDDVGEFSDAVLGGRLERTLDNDIREVDLSLHQARNDAAAAKAQRVASENETKQSKATIAEAERATREMLDKRRLKAARARAADVVARQARHAALQRETKALVDTEATLADLVAQLEQKLRRMKHQLGTLRATAGIQRAQAAVARLQPGPDPHPESAQRSAQRVHARAGAGDASATKRAPRKPGKAGATSAESAVDAIIERLAADSTPAPRTRKTGKTRTAP